MLVRPGALSLIIALAERSIFAVISVVYYFLVPIRRA